MVCFHSKSSHCQLQSLAADEKAWWEGMKMCKNFYESCILQISTESLKPFIVSGVSWSVKLVLLTETQKSHFCVRPWSLLTKPLRTGADRHYGILMPLLLLVAETKLKHMFNLNRKCKLLKRAPGERAGFRSTRSQTSN